MPTCKININKGLFCLPTSITMVINQLQEKKNSLDSVKMRIHQNISKAPNGIYHMR